MYHLLADDLEPLTKDFLFFDQLYSPMMKDHPYYKAIRDEPYDRYRDLDLVWSCELLDGQFGCSNTLLIDSDDKKVQLWIENSIVTQPYTFDDIQLKNSHDHQIEYINKLSHFIVEMAESGDEVPEWLSKN
jgi:hypothetical protein